MTQAECHRIFSQLSEYMDAELPVDLCRQIEAHIARCPPCVEFVESLKKTVALCKEIQSEQPPETLTEDARRQLREAYRRMLEGMSQKP